MNDADIVDSSAPLQHLSLLDSCNKTSVPIRLHTREVGARIMKMNELCHKFNGWMRKIPSANIIYVLVLHEIFMLSFTILLKLFIV